MRVNDQSPGAIVVRTQAEVFGRLEMLDQAIRGIRDVLHTSAGWVEKRASVRAKLILAQAELAIVDYILDRGDADIASMVADLRATPAGAPATDP